eukprot:TRINITY_DN15038_c0_g1_i1.p1 TRINITY_DN15038_c0_g1~~TRINITY_DN15038_c0_g1_i1.p1  ORF type:complete len:154 (+),score=37.36 TRINITY_DN15038_c0_g1_i1:18-479(+)
MIAYRSVTCTPKRSMSLHRRSDFKKQVGPQSLIRKNHSGNKMGVTKEVTQQGNGPEPKKGANITVHCTGYTELPGQDLKKFWSTRDTNEPFSFNVGMGQVIRGWDEGFMSMKVGERAKLHLSSDYAYGAKGFPAWGIPANAPLMFDVEILSIN